MRIKRITLVASVLLAGELAGTVAATAEDITMATAVGQEVQIRRVTLISGRTCAGSLPPVNVLRTPAHGKVETRPARFVATYGKCNGQEVSGGLVFYIPAAGFTGTDSFVFNYIWGTSNKGGSSFSPNYTATITVK